MSEHISTAEAARLLGVTPKTVIALYQSGQLDGYLLETNGGARTHVYKIDADSVRRFKEARRRGAPLDHRQQRQ